MEIFRKIMKVICIGILAIGFFPVWGFVALIISIVYPFVAVMIWAIENDSSYFDKEVLIFWAGCIPFGLIWALLDPFSH